MYNRLYSNLVNKQILYPKELGFQKGHSTEHGKARGFRLQLYQKYHSFMGVFHVFSIVKIVPNPAKHHIFMNRLKTILLKSSKSMELREQIVPDSKVTWNIGNNNFKSLMKVKTMYEM